MRVLFSTTAGAGHFAPMIPFVRSCLHAGHEVRVAAPASFASTVLDAGFEYTPFDDADPTELRAVFSQLHLATVAEANLRVIREVFGRIDAIAAATGLRGIVDEWRPDVLVAEIAEFGSALVAEERQLPQLRVNIGLDTFTEQVLDAVDGPLRELGCATGSERVRAAPRLSLFPARFDQRGNAASVARFRDTSPGVGDGQPVPAEWWPRRSSDQPLVYVTFGSVAGHLGFYPDFYRRVAETLADLPVRVLMTLGAGLDPAGLGQVAPNIRLESWVPQQTVLNDAAAVVSHGGFGTLIATLARGLPQVIVPLFSADQYANADRVGASRVGLSLSPGDPAALRSADLVPAGPDVSRLADALTRVLSDRTVVDAAEQIAAELAGLPSTDEFLPLLPAPATHGVS